MSIKYFYNFCLKDIDDAELQSDILSGIRRRYFDDFIKIKDKITISSDRDSLSYEYTIERDKPMKWAVNSHDAVLQDVMLADSDKYYIYFYQDQVLWKRLLFSKLHTLLRAEYFDGESGLVSHTLEPRKSQGGLCLLLTSRTEPQPVVLYPYTDVIDPRVAMTVADKYDDYVAVASTNEGIVRFFTEDRLQELRAYIDISIEELNNTVEATFTGEEAPLYDKINAKDFNVKRNLAASLDITMARDFVSIVDDTDSLPTADALETSFDGSVTVDPVTEDPAMSECVADTNAEAEIEADSLPSDERQPDKYIMADGAVFTYYGELDSAGNRSGYGRTLTEHGRTAYEGCYLNDKRSGNGSYFYKDGSLCYTGDWLENARHGVGVGVSSADGSIHAGKWSNNRPLGNGVRLSAEGEIKFVCKELSDGKTVLMNYMPDDTVIISKYDETGKKLSESTISLVDFS